MDQLKSYNESYWNAKVRAKFNALVDVVNSLVQDSEQVVAIPFYPFAELLTEDNLEEILPEDQENQYDTRLLQGMALGNLYVTNVKVG